MIGLLKSYCEDCNQKGFQVPEGEFINHYVKTNQTFDLYCKEQLSKGKNIIHGIDGCSLCNPEMKWPPGAFVRWCKRFFGLG
ncbi:MULTISPECIES: hypothetical protein [unclassified Paenibacillus]|uniref:hypothetical protein n=1 Tax=unclassified Paenibacillus TaxID=185978 RepID=UPI0009A5BC8D|nr:MULTISPECIES: hypothetical protein [unclassified Paenibacillus]SLK16777.1 hypothetical protein SAMN06272722_110247 [Paenibacillus sp. RU5A]SOC74468.1 hypothetical protein SAMN05880581_110247 [Paenibacillus sp. RU26A]SOC76656.1 hypothetical protein SAMN05880586_110247 [Paenibacillus sp. RU5M]